MNDISGGGDPPQSHDGAEAIEPERFTIRERCLRRLLAARGAKIPTSDFAGISKSAERRVRELRDPEHGNWKVQCERVGETRTFVYWIDPMDAHNPPRTLVEAHERDIHDWISEGAEKGWSSMSVCATHDGIPSTPFEDGEWEAGGDPCQFIVRVWT